MLVCQGWKVPTISYIPHWDGGFFHLLFYDDSTINYVNWSFKTLFHDMVRSITSIPDDEALKNHDCFVLILSGHGGGGTFRFSDEKNVNISNIVRIFNNEHCHNLAGKPKIFILNACRGGMWNERLSTLDSCKASIYICFSSVHLRNVLNEN